MTYQTVYPGLKRLLEQELADWAEKKNCDIPSARRLSKEIEEVEGKKFSHTSLHDWLSGKAKPHTNSVRVLAHFFYPDDVPEQDEFVARIRKATNIPQSGLDPMDVLETGIQGPLRIGVIRLEHFCDTNRKGFLDGLMDHFFRFAGFGDAEFKEESINEIELKLRNGQIDLVLGLFMEPRRSRHLWFYQRLPILVPLNAVTFRSGNSDFQTSGLQSRVLQMLTNPEAYERSRNEILPIIDYSEIAGIYVREFLRFNAEQDSCSINYKISEYQKALTEIATSAKERPIPLAVIDEISCAYLAVELQRKPHRFRPFLISPPMKNLEKPQEIPENVLPRFRYSFAASRSHTRWIKFLVDALDSFVDANPAIIAYHLKELYSNLTAKFEGQIANPDELIKSWFSGKVTSEAWKSAVEIAIPPGDPRLTLPRQTEPEGT